MGYVDELLAAKITEDQTEMSAQEVEDALYHLDEWELIENDQKGYQIKREFECQSPEDAVAFVNVYNKMAAERGHFPDVKMLEKFVTITCYTADKEGLTRNDFIMAAQADDLFARWDVIAGERDRVTQASDESFPASDPPAY